MIKALRNLLKEGRVQSASFEDAKQAELEFVPLQLDIRSKLHWMGGKRNTYK